MYETPFGIQLFVWAVEGVAFVLVNLLWFGLATYALVLLRRVRRQLVAMPAHDRPHLKRPLIKQTLTRFVRLAVLWCVLTAVFNYWLDVDVRRSAYDCKRSTSEQYKDMYFAEVCLVVGGDRGYLPEGYTVILNLYDSKTGDLLGREFVSNPYGSVDWQDDLVGQSGWDKDGISGAAIHLPPSDWDRFKARLP
ncbi:MAG: hypothetical protein QE265_06135 [Rhodoferax sp.]|nr:hypothetical protein [Rhodoferax sp.]